MKVNVVTLCSGYDSQCMAMEQLKREIPDFDYELLAWAEFDPESKAAIDKQPAVVAHNAVFPQWAGRNLGDMTKIDWASWMDEHGRPRIDLLTYSTPCQSVSNAGRQDGIAKGSGTRSAVLWYTESAIRTLKPRFLLMENVKALVSKKFMPDFKEWLDVLSDCGYRNYWQVLNAKNYGVAQNRERVFVVSVREDIGLEYEFPKPFPLEKTVEDYLEDEETIEEGFYLKDEQVDKFLDLVMVDFTDEERARVKEIQGFKGLKDDAEALQADTRDD